MSGKYSNLLYNVFVLNSILDRKVTKRTVNQKASNYIELSGSAAAAKHKLLAEKLPSNAYIWHIFKSIEEEQFLVNLSV